MGCQVSRSDIRQKSSYSLTQFLVIVIDSIEVHSFEVKAFKTWIMLLSRLLSLVLFMTLLTVKAHVISSEADEERLRQAMCVYSLLWIDSHEQARILGLPAQITQSTNNTIWHQTTDEGQKGQNHPTSESKCWSNHSSCLRTKHLARVEREAMAPYNHSREFVIHPFFLGATLGITGILAFGPDSAITISQGHHVGPKRTPPSKAQATSATVFVTLLGATIYWAGYCLFRDAFHLFTKSLLLLAELLLVLASQKHVGEDQGTCPNPEFEVSFEFIQLFEAWLETRIRFES